MVKLFTFALVLCAALVFAQRVTHRDPRYLAELSSGGGGGGFSPANTNDLKLWYDLGFGLVTRDTNWGTEITFWTNRGTFLRFDSGGPDRLQSIAETPASSPALPLLQANLLGTNPAIKFSVSNISGNLRFQYMLGSGTFSNATDGRWTNSEMFVVVKASIDPAQSGAQPSNSFIRMNFAGMAAPFQHYPYSDGLIYEPWGTSVRKDGITPTIRLTNWIIYNIVSRPGLYQIRQNGNVIYSGTTNTVAWSVDALMLGASTLAVPYRYDGWLAELLVYGNSELSVADRLQTMQYLTNKFGSTNFPSLSL